MPGNISKELISAYRATQYRIFAPSTFSLVIDEYSASMADLHHEYACSNSAFITACNPYSRISDDATNARNNDSLKAILHPLCRMLFAAEGADPNGKWPIEKGYLAIGIDLATVQDGARQFKQNAIVSIRENCIPELCLLQ